MSTSRRKAQDRKETARLSGRAKEIKEEAELIVTDSIWDKCPLKQYVRKYGWINSIEKYISEMRNYGVNRHWKYLTLPGKNAIDIAYLVRERLIEKLESGQLCVAICDYKWGLKVANKLEKHGGILAYSDRFLDKALIKECSAPLKLDRWDN